MTALQAVAKMMAETNITDWSKARWVISRDIEKELAQSFQERPSFVFGPYSRKYSDRITLLYGLPVIVDETLPDFTLELHRQ